MKILIDLNLDENVKESIDFSSELTNKITALRLQSVDKIQNNIKLEEEIVADWV